MDSSSGVAPPSGLTVEVVPLGGVGEFGMNMMVVSCQGTTIVIDAGVRFPDPELLGVDLVIPDLTYLERLRPRAAALFLTHGHQDHIGAVPYVWPLIDGPVYGSPLTLALARVKLEAHDIDPEGRLVPVQPRDMLACGSLRLECLRVTHSIPDAFALAIHTPIGVLVHSGDFKFDPTPLDGRTFDLHRFAELGTSGVLALLSDSTNVDRPGVTGSELDVVPGLEDVFATTTGQILVATFSSSLYRLQVLVNLAVRFDRKVAFVGRGMLESTRIAQQLGHLDIPAEVHATDAEVASLPPERVLCITTGSQGEPRSALSRIAIDDHKHIKIHPGDTVVFSARTIPGHERAIGRVSNHLARRGARIVYDGPRRVHVSGHASAEELKLVLSLLRPRYFTPIHGEYRQLSRHAALAEQVCGPDVSVLLAENGQMIEFEADAARLGGTVPAGRVLIDRTRTGEVIDEILRDRRHISEDGVVVPVIVINQQTGAMEGAPDVISRGLVLPDGAGDVVRDAIDLVAAVVRDATLEERTDQALIEEAVRSELRRFFRKRFGRRPLVVPVIMEI